MLNVIILTMLLSYISSMYIHLVSISTNLDITKKIQALVTDDAQNMVSAIKRIKL